MWPAVLLFDILNAIDMNRVSLHGLSFNSSQFSYPILVFAVYERFRTMEFLNLFKAFTNDFILDAVVVAVARTTYLFCYLNSVCVFFCGRFGHGNSHIINIICKLLSKYIRRTCVQDGLFVSFFFTYICMLLYGSGMLCFG